MKVCSKCGSSEAGFYKRSSALDGLSSVCKKCHYLYTAERRRYNAAKKALWAAREKRCTCCGSVENGFYKDSRAADGLKSECKACHQKNVIRWNLTNPERRKQIHKASAIKYADARAKATRNWQIRNKLRVAETKKRASANRQRKILHDAEYASQVKEMRRVSGAAWKAENKEAVRAHTRNRRARKRGVEGVHTAEDIRRLFDAQNGYCGGCGRDFSVTGYHVDHIQPLSRGGSNWPDNLQLLCPTCNTRKAAMDMDTFLKRWSRETDCG